MSVMYNTDFIQSNRLIKYLIIYFLVLLIPKTVWLENELDHSEKC